MPDVVADREKVADAVLDEVKHFTIGFALAGDTPAAKGSGVLIKHGERYGILTCAHVDTYLRTLNRPVGLVRLNRGLARRRRWRWTKSSPMRQAKPPGSRYPKTSHSSTFR